MDNTPKMPWLSEAYIATKRAFKKRLGLFDKDVVVEEYEEHERELEEDYEDYEAYEETEMERRHEEAGVERQIEQEQGQEQYRVEKRWEDFSIAEIEKEYKQKNKGNRL